MNQKKLDEMVALLKAGQAVTIATNVYIAKRCSADQEDAPCHYCNVDCLCGEEVCEVCNELDVCAKSRYYLWLIA